MKFRFRHYRVCYIQGAKRKWRREPNWSTVMNFFVTKSLSFLWWTLSSLKGAIGHAISDETCFVIECDI